MPARAARSSLDLSVIWQTWQVKSCERDGPETHFFMCQLLCFYVKLCHFFLALSVFPTNSVNSFTGFHWVSLSLYLRFDVDVVAFVLENLHGLGGRLATIDRLERCLFYNMLTILLMV